jgi:hypothetical protein
MISFATQIGILSHALVILTAMAVVPRWMLLGSLLLLH